MGTNISFKALPQHLKGVNIYETNYKGITDIIKDAGAKACVVIKASSHEVFDNNKDLFDKNGHVSDKKRARDTINFYAQFIPKGHINTCADMRDAVANCYKQRLKDDPSTKVKDLIML